MTHEPYRGLDDPRELRRSLTYSPRLSELREVELGSGPAWELGRVGLLRGYPGFEIADLPYDLMSAAAFRKVPFDFPDEGLRGFLAVLAADCDRQRVYDVVAGWVPPEGERDLDEWIRLLNDEIKEGHRAHPDVGPDVDRRAASAAGRA